MQVIIYMELSISMQLITKYTCALNIPCGRNSVLAFTTAHEQPFPFPLLVSILHVGAAHGYQNVSRRFLSRFYTKYPQRLVARIQRSM